MRCLVISDIHSNLAAFKAVLDDAEGKYDKVWCLGDLVGYGPNPNECIELLGGLDHLCIAGNHLPAKSAATVIRRAGPAGSNGSRSAKVPYRLQSTPLRRRPARLRGRR